MLQKCEVLNFICWHKVSATYFGGHNCQNAKKIIHYSLVLLIQREMKLFTYYMYTEIIYGHGRLYQWHCNALGHRSRSWYNLCQTFWVKMAKVSKIIHYSPVIPIQRPLKLFNNYTEIIYVLQYTVCIFFIVGALESSILLEFSIILL